MRPDIKKPYFIYVGNAYPHKNLKRLIEAVVLLNKNQDQKISLAIASSRNVFIERLEKIIDSLKANDFIKVLGFVPDEELNVLFKNSAGFVFPSLSEGFGLPGLEAMRAETLVLASDTLVFREIYKDSAIYFNPLDFTSIEKTMVNVLLMSADERRKRVEKAKKLADSYSWSKMARKTLNLYESSI